jgi:hypothetical protein
MKKLYIIIILVACFFSFQNFHSTFITAEDEKIKSTTSEDNITIINNEVKKNYQEPYKYPETYRGIYLNVASGRDIKKLKTFIDMAKKSYINTFVIDVQGRAYKSCVIPEANVALCRANGIHPIARVVMFPDGLKHFPVEKSFIDEKIKTAQTACERGFKEIQFDYIRFEDSGKLKYLTAADRAAFIGDVLLNAREELKKYNVRTAADIFGRIPLNKNDIIGQHMESLDEVVDIICPMAYPSHYTWSKKLQYDPYHTVYITSKKAADRVKKAEIVTYIQAFRMKLGDIPYDKYIYDQLLAIKDSGVRGFLMWNAAQNYEVPFEVMKKFYNSKVTRDEKSKILIDQES